MNLLTLTCTVSLLYLTIPVAVEAVAKKLFEKLLNLLEDKVSIAMLGMFNSYIVSDS